MRFSHPTHSNFHRFIENSHHLSQSETEITTHEIPLTLCDSPSKII
jgi:hypothetical protein